MIFTVFTIINIDHKTILLNCNDVDDPDDDNDDDNESECRC